MSAWKKFILGTILFLMLALVFEAASWASARFLQFAWLAPDQKSFAATLNKVYTSERFDPLLGWRQDPESLDEHGARKVPNRNFDEPTCIKAYGDSYTFGDEVGHAAVWTAQLERHLACRVTNYGVSAYRPDQAVLRYIRNPDYGRKNVVILGILSENIIRIVNQNRSYIYHGIYMPKPRFITDGDGKLKLVPLVRLKEEDYERFTREPQKVFPDEYFIPGRNYDAKQLLSFPYSVAVANSVQYRRVLHGLGQLVSNNVPPWYRTFYFSDHPSRALELMQRILKDFVRHAEQRGDTPLVVLFPNSRDFVWATGAAQFPHLSLSQWLSRNGIAHFDFGPALLRSPLWQEVKKDVCRYFCTKKFTKGGHYTERGHALFAKMLSDYLSKELPVGVDSAKR